MVLLENKIDIFNRIVYQQKQEECAKKLKENRRQCREILKAKTAEIDRECEEIVDRRVKLAKQKSCEMLSNENEEKRIRELQKNKIVLLAFLNDLKKKLEEFSKTEEYIEFETRRFKNVIKDLDEGEYIVYVLNRDIKLKSNFREIAEERDIYLQFNEMDEFYLGGFIISDKEKSYNLNCSLKARIEDEKYEIGKMLKFALKERV
jgi:vacuolar-type H+-ATPase subunit E/Vma4